MTKFSKTSGSNQQIDADRSVDKYDQRDTRNGGSASAAGLPGGADYVQGPRSVLRGEGDGVVQQRGGAHHQDPASPDASSGDWRQV